MAAERNAHAGASGSGDDIGNAQRRFLGALDLPGDTDLHIVDQQGSSIGREPVGELLGIVIGWIFLAMVMAFCRAWRGICIAQASGARHRPVRHSRS